jgi:hypothetical protein
LIENGALKKGGPFSQRSLVGNTAVFTVMSAILLEDAAGLEESVGELARFAPLVTEDRCGTGKHAVSAGQPRLLIFTEDSGSELGIWFKNVRTTPVPLSALAHISVT